MIGLVGARERPRLARVPPPAGATLARRGAPRSNVLRRALRVLGDPAGRAAGRQPRGAWLLVEATTAASALLVGFSGQPRALEAGWKYLVLTSLGLGVALLGIVLLAPARRAAGLGALSWRALSTYAAAPTRPRRLPAAPRRARGEDRLGAGAQLAARRPHRGAAAGVRAALRRAAAGRPARSPGARAGPRSRASERARRGC